MFQSIGRRLVASYIFLVLLAVGVVGLTTYQLAKNYSEDREVEGLRSNAKAIAIQAEPLLLSRLDHLELEQLAETSAFLGDMRVRILDRDEEAIIDSGTTNTNGKVILVAPWGVRFQGTEERSLPGMFFYQYKPGMPLDFPDELFETIPPGASFMFIESQDGLWGTQFSYQEVVVTGDDRLEGRIESISRRLRSDAAVLYPIGDPGNPVGYIELSEPYDYGSGFLDDLSQALVIAGIVAILLAVGLGLWNSRRLSAPIRDLANISAKMKAGDLSVRASVNNGGEIGELASQFNQMADHLQSSFDQLANERDTLRRFIADASHELRTPITALKNFNSLLLDKTPDDPTLQVEFLTESQAQINRLEWITQNLLVLSRMDAGLINLGLSEYDLRELITSAVASYKPLAAEKGILIKIKTPNKPVILKVDGPQMQMVLSNLLDNALKFTPTGGEINILLEHSANQALIRVEDNGIGIASEELPHIFERFYRGRGHNIEGSGLGLAIVKSIVNAHGGHVSVVSEPDKGSTFEIVLLV